MPLDLQLLQQALNNPQRPARWKAAENHVSVLEPERRRRRLGFVPGANELTLKNREDLARAHHQGARLAIAAAPPPYPPAYDLRNVSGQSFITPVKDQGQCGSCCAFGSVAAMEGTYQVASNQPASGIDLSEAHVFFCYGAQAGRVCGCNNEPNSGWSPDAALAAESGGVAAENSYPYPAEIQCTDYNCPALPDNWQASAMKVTGWHGLNSMSDMKTWIATRGPLVTTMSVYEDFYNYQSGVYHYVSGGLDGGHCVCAVGYDDTQQCWICKNSWGPGWGQGGFFLIGFSECGIDATMYAVEGVAPM